MNFPLDLERDIFEIAAHRDAQCAYRLLFVARRVNEWIEPLIYRVLFKIDWRLIGDYPPLREHFSGKEITPRFRKVCTYTRHLLLQRIHVSDAVDVLNLCTNVRNVALWHLDEPYDPGPLLDVIRLLSVQRLSVELTRLFRRKSGEFQFDLTIFNHITHLELIGTHEDFWQKEGEKLLLLPRLTHLALEGTKSDEMIELILSKSTTLELLIVFSGLGFDEKDAIPTYALDPRLVRLSSTSTPTSDWMRSAKTGFDFWTTGEGLKQKGGLSRLGFQDKSR